MLILADLGDLHGICVLCWLWFWLLINKGIQPKFKNEIMRKNVPSYDSNQVAWHGSANNDVSFLFTSDILKHYFIFRLSLYPIFGQKTSTTYITTIISIHFWYVRDFLQDLRDYNQFQPRAESTRIEKNPGPSNTVNYNSAQGKNLNLRTYLTTDLSFTIRSSIKKTVVAKL